MLYLESSSIKSANFSLNVWAGIIGDNLLGPFFLSHILNGENYLQFLQNDLPELLDDVPLLIRQQAFFVYDGASTHFQIIVRDFFNATYANRWIGRGGPVPWPARSPDCNPLDFYLWDHVKSLVYIDLIADIDTRIINAFQTVRNTPGIFERVRRSLIRRMEACIVANGSHFEHFL